MAVPWLAGWVVVIALVAATPIQVCQGSPSGHLICDPADGPSTLWLLIAIGFWALASYTNWRRVRRWYSICVVWIPQACVGLALIALRYLLST